MGTCLSKKATNATSPTVPDPPVQIKANITDPDKKTTTTEHQEILKKDIFVIKHRRSHEIERRKEEEKPSSDKEQVLEISKPDKVNNASGFGGNGINSVVMAATPVRTSSCTKEELDAILIQCGRLSRSSSTGKARSGENPNLARSGRKYSGSKRSYDFDQENAANDDSGGGGGDEVVAEAERIHRHRNRQREPRVSSPSSSRRRRTPSRERDEQGNSQSRSGSRERASGSGGGRRVSRSPGRRSESPITNLNVGQGSNSSSGNANNNRPGKMVSVPPTVSSIAMDKSNNGGGDGSGSGEAPMGGGSGGVRRIQVKKNVTEALVVGSRTSASPRTRSPARAVRIVNENQNQEQKQPLSLSRSNSRKAEQSPYRRNPLGDIDNNVPGNDQANQPSNKAAMHKVNGEKISSNKTKHVVDECRGDLHSITGNVAVTLLPALTESLPQALTRTRSSRRSRDFDINPETLTNPNPTTYTSLLLDDIQNFHQKGTPQPAFSLPSCLTKANSILEAVADLNSTTSSNLSSTFSEDRRINFNKNNDEKKNLLVGALEEPEMEVMGDLVEPTLHKYVTFRRGPTGGEDMEEQESSGSNSFAGSQQVNWLTSSWEPTSGDSSDCWTSSKSNTKDKDFNPLGFQKSAVSEPGHEKKREMDNQRSGIGRGRLGSGRSSFSLPNAAPAST